MFICMTCGMPRDLFNCNSCNSAVEKLNGVYIFTKDPNMQVDNDQKDKYVGYDEIGEFYNGKYWDKVSDKDYAVGKAISKIVGKGVLLDLACGDGFITVPATKYGCKIIAADISIKMLSLLRERAFKNNISLANVTICKMNALDIKLVDESVDCVVANGVLHLISNPQKVISEIYRVLKPGGKLITLNDAPGKKSFTNVDENKQYYKLVNDFYDSYWKLMKKENIEPQKYSWKFDKNTEIEKLFTNKAVQIIEFSEGKRITFEDGFLYRFKGKGFSDQATVPDKIHKIIFNKVVKEFTDFYGISFLKSEYVGTEDGVYIDLYEKR